MPPSEQSRLSIPNQRAKADAFPHYSSTISLSLLTQIIEEQAEETSSPKKAEETSGFAQKRLFRS
jgi:hypothetical protein